MVNKIDLISDGEFIKLINNSSCISDVLRYLGYSTNGNSWGNKIVKERMQKLQLSFTKKQKSSKRNSEKLSLKDILTEDSGYSRSHLKERLLNEGVKEYKCEICGISEWNGKPISLQLHHINGINNDNRLENLQFICPNCHSQTENFTTKGRGRVIVKKAEALPKEDVELIMNTVREVGIVEARKQLNFRNSLINSVVKSHRDTIVMEDLEGNIKCFNTTVEAADYMFNQMHVGKTIEGLRSGISKCCCGKQKTVAGGYKFYRRSVEE